MPILVNNAEFYQRYRQQIDGIRNCNIAKLLFSFCCFANCIAIAVLIRYHNQAFIVIPFIGSIIAFGSSILNIVTFSSEQRIATFTKNPVGYRYGVSFSDIPIAVAFGMYIYLSIVTSSSYAAIRAPIISFTVLALLVLLMSTAYEITMKRIVAFAIVHSSIPTTVVPGATVAVTQTAYPPNYPPNQFTNQYTNQYSANYGQQYPPPAGQVPQGMIAPSTANMQSYPASPSQLPPTYTDVQKQAPPPDTK
ncbi:hypothetical protein TrispH2_000680 [Trichoplax sp. H2]|nr:hypothetical protein TrispH2_000680 [Trichoplax sp. H2]|eukprot:RDD47768.1 hypothetical protein TrispH2_000680 [Trichoplax sp. H2]